MNKKVGLIVTLVLFNFASKAESKVDQNTLPATKSLMTEILNQFMGLKKYLVSDEEFQEPKNAAAISEHLKNLAATVKKTAHDPTLIKDNYKFSRDVLEDHVVETERVFRLGNKSYARWMTNSTLGICMSCHTQMPTTQRDVHVFMKSNNFSSKFDQAEFMFATKNFEGANKIYEKIITDFKKSDDGSSNLEKSIQRELAYHIRIKRDFAAAKALISEVQKNKQLPEFVTRNLSVWKDQIGKWQGIELPKVESGNSKDILKFTEERLSTKANHSGMESSDPRFISDLVVSGILYEYIQKVPTNSETPEVLYWLATIDRELNHSAFFSLADLYLKECMLKFPESPTAPKCYKEYSEEMILGYTGSAGTNIPIDVTNDLKFLKQFVDSKGKVPLKRAP